MRISEFIILFFITSIGGWCIEVILKYIQFHRFINRGFLIGPYCPIYGWGVLAITVLVGGLLMRKGTIVETFFIGLVVCGVLEYFTSWYMEKRFHARWWDYSQKPMNLHGRVWIGNLILFGVASVLVIWFLDPWYFSKISNVSSFWTTFMGWIIVATILLDHAVSHFLIGSIKTEIDRQQGDDTEYMTKELRRLLKDKHMLVRRIHEAYPKLHIRRK